MILINIMLILISPSDRVREKNENCALFWRRIVRDKKLIDWVGNCAGLRNLVSNKIFRIPLSVKVNIEFSL